MELICKGGLSTGPRYIFFTELIQLGICGYNKDIVKYEITERKIS